MPERMPYRQGQASILDYYRRFIRHPQAERCQPVGPGAWTRSDGITKAEAQRHITEELHRRINGDRPEFAVSRRNRDRNPNRHRRRRRGVSWRSVARDWNQNYWPDYPMFLNPERTQFNLWHLRSEVRKRNAAAARLAEAEAALAVARAENENPAPCDEPACACCHDVRANPRLNRSGRTTPTCGELSCERCYTRQTRRNVNGKPCAWAGCSMLRAWIRYAGNADVAAAYICPRHIVAVAQVWADFCRHPYTVQRELTRRGHAPARPRFIAALAARAEVAAAAEGNAYERRRAIDIAPRPWSWSPQPWTAQERQYEAAIAA